MDIIVYVGPNHIYSNYCIFDHKIMAKKQLLGDTSGVEEYTASKLKQMIRESDNVFIMEPDTAVGEYEIAFDRMIEYSEGRLDKIFPVCTSMTSLGYNSILTELDRSTIETLIYALFSPTYFNIHSCNFYKAFLYSFHKVFEGIDKDKLYQQYRSIYTSEIKLPKSYIEMNKHGSVIDKRLYKLLHIHDRFKQSVIIDGMSNITEICAVLLNESRYRAYPYEIETIVNSANTRYTKLTIISEKDFNLEKFTRYMISKYCTDK